MTPYAQVTEDGNLLLNRDAFCVLYLLLMAHQRDLAFSGLSWRQMQAAFTILAPIEVRDQVNAWMESFASSM
jgi:hypothetical protein